MRFHPHDGPLRWFLSLHVPPPFSRRRAESQLAPQVLHSPLALLAVTRPAQKLQIVQVVSPALHPCDDVIYLQVASFEVLTATGAVAALLSVQSRPILRAAGRYVLPALNVPASTTLDHSSGPAPTCPCRVHSCVPDLRSTASIVTRQTLAVQSSSSPGGPERAS